MVILLEAIRCAELDSLKEKVSRFCSTQLKGSVDSLDSLVRLGWAVCQGVVRWSGDGGLNIEILQCLGCPLSQTHSQACYGVLFGQSFRGSLEIIRLPGSRGSRWRGGGLSREREEVRFGARRLVRAWVARSRGRLGGWWALLCSVRR
jgi:hypothetical protein